MRNAFTALLPDFAQGEPAVPPARSLASEEFVPFMAAGAGPPDFNPSAFPPSGGKPVSAPAAKSVAEPLGHDAAGLQSMLSEAFTAPDAQPVAAAPRVEHTEPTDEPPRTATPVDEGPDKDAMIAELTAKIDQLRQAHTAELARIAVDAVPAMAEAVGAAVKAALGPIIAHRLMAAVQDEAVNRFSKELVEMIRNGNGVHARISGTQALLDRIRADWPPDLAAPDLVVDDGVELVAIIDEQVLSTRLGEIGAILSGGSR